MISYTTMVSNLSHLLPKRLNVEQLSPSSLASLLTLLSFHASPYSILEPVHVIRDTSSTSPSLIPFSSLHVNRSMLDTPGP